MSPFAPPASSVWNNVPAPVTAVLPLVHDSRNANLNWVTLDLATRSESP